MQLLNQLIKIPEYNSLTEAISNRSNNLRKNRKRIMERKRATTTTTTTTTPPSLRKNIESFLNIFTHHFSSHPSPYPLSPLNNNINILRPPLPHPSKMSQRPVNNKNDSAAK